MSRVAGRVFCGAAATVAAIVGACASPQLSNVRPSGTWGSEDRVLVSDFSEIEAVAASPWLVFAATPHGLVIYDRVARRFKPPVTALDGYPGGRVRRAIADPAGNAVWLDLGSGLGSFRFDVDGRAWTRGPLRSGQVDGTLTVEAALASAPVADAMRAAILTDSRLRTHQFTAAAGTPERPEIFFGTNGMGLVRVDKQTGEWEVLSYGLVTPGVGAVTLAPDGIWAAATARPGGAGGGGGGQRRGLTWVATDLSATRTVEGGGAVVGFTFVYSRRLLTAANQLWLATEQGVLRIDPSTFRSRLFDLPNATSLARAPDGVWVGTTRGLSLITGDDRVVAMGPSGVAVVSLLAVRETLWVGTTAGLAQLAPGSATLATPPELVDRPGLRVTVHALARLQDTIVMATARELLWRDPVSHAWSAVPLPLNLGIPTALAADPNGGLWIGGTLGLAQAEIARATIRVHTVPFELPAAVRDVTADRDFVWAATDSGLVRIR